jgi:hypothetical protein
MKSLKGKDINKIFLHFLPLFIFFACTLPGPQGNPAGSRQVTISGYVKSIADSKAVSGAQVIIKNAQTVSGSNGYFTITARNVADTDSFKVAKDGFVDYLRPLLNFAGKSMTVEITLKPVDIALEIDPALPGGNTITTFKNASVYIPQLDNISEHLIVSLTSFDVGTEEIDCVPGDFTAIDKSNAETTIISMGMIDVSIKGKDTGKNYDLKSTEEKYKIAIPITGDAGSAPDTIERWYFDENRCKWIEDGTLARGGDNMGFYIGNVSHFTPWNSDYPFPRINVYGTISDQLSDGETYQVKLTTNGSSMIWYQNEKEIYIPSVPKGWYMKLDVTKMSTRVTWTRSFYSSCDSNCINIGVIPTQTDLPEVTGLVTSVSSHDVAVSWTGEPANIAGVTVEYYMLGTSLVNYVSLAQGVKHTDLAGLNPGPYVIAVKTFDAGHNESNGLSKRVRIDDAFVLAVSISNAPAGSHILYWPNSSTGFVSLFSDLLAVVPRKTKITLDLDVPQEKKSGYYWMFSHGANTDQLYGFPQDFDIEDDSTIYLGSNSCS